MKVKVTCVKVILMKIKVILMKVKVVLMKVKVNVTHVKVIPMKVICVKNYTYESRLGRAVHCRGRTLTFGPVGHEDHQQRSWSR